MSDVIHLPWRQKPGLRTVYALTLFSALLPVIGLSLVQVGMTYQVKRKTMKDNFSTDMTISVSP